MSAFIISERTMHRAVLAMDLDMRRSPEWLDNLGQQLYALNAEAVRQRYAHNPEATAELLASLPAEPYRWEWPALPKAPTTDRMTRVQLYKALQCLHYQCSEGNVPQTLLYQTVEKRLNEMAAQIVSDLPEYGEAEWDG